MKKIYLVGGAVRDMIMNISNSDKDYVAVGYNEDDFRHLRKVGKDFPVFLNENNEEIALARIERKISNGYNGFSYDTSNVSLEDDLLRRDLTINSIAYDETTKEFIDPFNGISDIKNQILRHTSDAFKEDPLRVLRLARFRAKFGYDWKIDKTTKVFVYQMRDELSYLQSDRVYKEIEKALILPRSDLFFATLFELGVLDIIFPSIYKLTTLKEGSIYHHEYSVFEHTMMVLQLLSNQSIVLKLSGLYHDIAKPYCYRMYGNSSGHDNLELIESLIDINIPAKIRKRVLFLIANHIKIIKLNEFSPPKMAKFFEQFKRDRKLLEELLILTKADSAGVKSNAKRRVIDEDKILSIFDKISTYSPKEWIETNSITNPNAIKQHIHNYNIKAIKLNTL